MLRDQGPVFRNLRAFVGFLQKQNLIARIEEPISTVLEVTELHRRVLARQGPALLLEQPIKSDGEMPRLPLLTNLFGTVERVSLGLGASEAGAGKTHLRALGARRQALSPMAGAGQTDADRGGAGR